MGEYLVESNIWFRKTNLYIYMYNRSRNGIWDRARLKFDTFTDKLYRCTHVKARRILRRKRSEINSTLIEGRDRTIRVSRRGGGGKHARQLVGEVDRKRKKEKKKSAIKMVMHQVIRAWYQPLSTCVFLYYLLYTRYSTDRKDRGSKKYYFVPGGGGPS